jgi:ABC-type nitrate/sulfonate/bicarbonate transport system substrate-binding protein
MTVRDVELVEKWSPPEMRRRPLYAGQVDAYATGEPFRGGRLKVAGVRTTSSNGLSWTRVTGLCLLCAHRSTRS